MPLTPNALNHIRRLYRLAWRERTTPVELRFAGRPAVIINGIWKSNDTSDPATGPQPGANAVASAQTADAALEVLTEDISIADLQSVVSLRPAAYDGTQPWGMQAHYLITQIQPKGAGRLPERAYVLLRRA